ncbi:porin family protein [Flectobacillus major]|uniref:porin family protein n=1 Tax=Flectobacillus major TaxID=103 RepID=UPI00047E0727|nr:porin family protein [Flectobacillus major]
MKKVTLMFAMLLAATSYINAQDSSDKRDNIMFGLKAGTNYSNVYDSQGEAFNANAKYGVAAGVYLGIPFGKLIGIQPEVLFSQKGFQATGKILGSTYDFTRTTSYIDVPIFLAIKPIKFITILAGPQFSYLIKQKDVFADGTTTVAQETEFSNDNLRKNIMCFVGGVDINLNHLVIGARAGWDVQNNSGSGSSTTPRYKNAWLQATIGFNLY